MAVDELPGQGARKRKATVQSARALKRTKTDQDVEFPQPPDIAHLEEQVTDTNKHLNNIVTLYQLARKEVKLRKRKAPAIVSLCRVFCRLLADGRLRPASASGKDTAISQWLTKRYQEYRTLLYRTLEGEDAVQHELALTLGMQLVREELSNQALEADAVWADTFQRLIQAILGAPAGSQHSEIYVDNYAQEWDDIRHHTFAAINQILSNQSQASPSETANALALLSKIPLPTTETLNHNIAPPLASSLSEQNLSGKSHKTKPLSLHTHRKTAQKAWLIVLSRPLSTAQRKTILGSMTSVLLPWLPQPTLLMDFLTDSYNTPGSTSLLALSGLYTLMSEHNLDYPSFYPKLYSLLTPQLLWSKHRSRFLRLMNTFLSSSHLPAALVASFVKALSRLALHGPPAAIVAIVPWVYNTLKAHPTCTFMLHRQSRTAEEEDDITEHGAPDPFDPDEVDPMNTGALESCLWELETLRHHWHPHVASLCGIVGQQFTKDAYNLEDFLDHSYGGLLEAEVGEDKKMKKTPVVEAVIPKRVFGEDEQKERLGGLLEGLLSRKRSS